MDEPAQVPIEAHNGFVECDANGNNPVPKPVYKALKETIEKITQ